MKEITPWVAQFNELVKLEDSEIVRKVLKGYMESSYATKGRYLHLKDEIVNYKVVYEQKWLNMPTQGRDGQYIYVTTANGSTYRLSAKNIKKYIRRIRRLI